MFDYVGVGCVVHGMAVVNAAVHDALRQAGVTATVIDIAAPSHERSIAARLGRLPRVLRGLRRAQVVACVSGQSAEELQSVACPPEARVTVAHNAFNYPYRPTASPHGDCRGRSGR